MLESAIAPGGRRSAGGARAPVIAQRRGGGLAPESWLEGAQANPAMDCANRRLLLSDGDHGTFLTMGFTLNELKLLRALLDHPAGEHYGLDLIRRSGLKSAVVYPLLARFEDGGLVVGEWEDIDESVEGRRRRRYYRLTGEGERVALEALREVALALAPPGFVFPALGTG